MMDSLQVPETLCLEFCNTGASVRLDRGPDGVPDTASLEAWLRDQGFPIESRAGAGELGKVHAFREILFRFLSGTSSTKDREIVAQEAERAVGRLRLKERAGEFSLVPDIAGLSVAEATLVVVALSAVRLLTGDTLQRMRVCANDECQWLFLDRSKNRSRRWCEMASCGNKMKARRHYERTKKALS